MARALSDVLGPRSYGGQSPLPKKLRFFTSKSGTEWVHLDEALALLIRVCAETPVVKPEEQNVEPQKNTTRECPVVKCGPCVCAPCAQPPPCEKCDECKCPSCERAEIAAKDCEEPQPKFPPAHPPTDQRPHKCPPCPAGTNSTGKRWATTHIVKPVVEQIGDAAGRAAAENIDEKFEAVKTCEGGYLYQIAMAAVCSVSCAVGFLICVAVERTLGFKCISSFTNSLTSPTAIGFFQCLQNLTKHRIFIHPVTGSRMSYEQVSEMRKRFAHQNDTERLTIGENTRVFMSTGIETTL